MTYVDITLTPAATYTYVHNGQIYDQIATTLAAHGAWQYVEYVDAINGATTYRRHIWRCKSASSGLPNDFYVMFQTNFTTATGVFSTTANVIPALAEGYASGTLSKLASTETSITPASDLTNPATWALSTYTPPATAFCALNSRYLSIGPTTNQTSVRLLYLVAKDGLMSNWGGVSATQATSAPQITYIGAYDTLLGASDPMPLIIYCYQSSLAGNASGGCTRAPLQTAGVAVTEVFGAMHRWYPYASSSSQVGQANPKSGTMGGILGNPSDTSWMKSDGGVQVGRCYLASYTQTVSTNSTKGFVRGYSKYVRTSFGGLATHSLGDTFLIDGKVHVGLGSVGYGIWDTTAA